MMHAGAIKILALVPNWIGDVAMCTPALRALHRRFPEADLTVAGRASACEVLEGIPWLSALRSIPPRPGLSEMLRVARGLRDNARDLAVVFPHSFRAALFAFLTRSRRRVGYKRGVRGALLTDRVAPYTEDGKVAPVYMAKEYLDLVGILGCKDDGEGLELHADPSVVETVRGQLEGPGPWVGIAPGAAFGPSKMWPADRFARVADMLKEQAGAQCVLLTGPGEEELRDAIRTAAKAPLVSCDEGRPTLDILKAAISQLDLLVCNDSGPRHVAVAFKVPTVCVMGPTSPRYSEGPYEVGRVLRVDVDCGPCQKPVCDTDHRCMTGISPELVVEAAKGFLRW